MKFKFLLHIPKSRIFEVNKHSLYKKIKFMLSTKIITGFCSFRGVEIGLNGIIENNENKMIKEISKVIQHEYLHYAIGKVLNDKTKRLGEEEIVRKIVGHVKEPKI